MTAAHKLGLYLTALMHPEPTADSRPTGPLPDTFDLLLGRVPAIVRRLLVDAGSNLDVLEMTIEEAEALPPERLENIRVVAARASHDDLHVLLNDLVASWAAKHEGVDLWVYGVHLAEDVIRHRPSYFALMRAARRLRRSCRTLPSISEVLDEIDDSEGLITGAVAALDELPSRLQSAQEVLGARRGGSRGGGALERRTQPPKPRPDLPRR